MLLTLEQMKLLSEVAQEAPDGKLVIIKNVNKWQLDELKAIDGMNMMTYEEHLILNLDEYEN